MPLELKRNLIREIVAKGVVLGGVVIGDVKGEKIGGAGKRRPL
jgi:hypothetical protein